MIRIVVDNLNTHTPAALYETFPPAEAHRILLRLEVHYTPKHGSWLNMVEIEFSVLAGQCLRRRLPDQATVQQEIASWEGIVNLFVPRLSKVRAGECGPHLCFRQPVPWLRFPARGEIYPPFLDDRQARKTDADADGSAGRWDHRR